jgi:hypothetical protein
MFPTISMHMLLEHKNYYNLKKAERKQDNYGDKQQCFNLIWETTISIAEIKIISQITR